MEKSFYIEELKHHLDYHKALFKEMDRLSDESTSLVKGLIEKREKGEELTVDPFVQIDYNNFKANSINVDVIKMEARIRLIMRYAINEGYDLVKEMPPSYQPVLQQITFTGTQAPEFLFVMDNDSLNFSSEEMESLIKEDAERRVKTMDLNAILDTYKTQYENYLKHIANGKETHEG